MLEKLKKQNRLLLHDIVSKLFYKLNIDNGIEKKYIVEKLEENKIKEIVKNL